MKENLVISLSFTLVTTVILGLVYPLVVPAYRRYCFLTGPTAS